MKYVTLNNIAAAGLARLPGNYVKVDALEQADAVLVRSANLLETRVNDILCKPDLYE